MFNGTPLGFYPLPNAVSFPMGLIESETSIFPGSVLDLSITHKSAASDNPKGIASFSPGLAHPAPTLGLRRKMIFNPNGVASSCSRRHASGCNPFSGLATLG